MPERSLSKHSTIYNYRLIHRIYHSRIALALSAASLLPIVIWDIQKGLFHALYLSFFIVIAAHTAIAKLYMTFLRSPNRTKSWGLSWRFPWVGYVPCNYTSFSHLLRIQQHIFWVGMAGFVAAAPWASSSFPAHLIIVHIWLIFPRYVILLKLRKKGPAEVIKISRTETSSYNV